MSNSGKRMITLVTEVSRTVPDSRNCLLLVDLGACRTYFPQTSNCLGLGKLGVGTCGEISQAWWGDCGKAGKHSSPSRYSFNINIATWNVDILGLSETLWKGVGELATGILTSYKVIFSGDTSRCHLMRRRLF